MINTKFKIPTNPYKQDVSPKWPFRHFGVYSVCPICNNIFYKFYFLLMSSLIYRLFIKYQNTSFFRIKHRLTLKYYYFFSKQILDNFKVEGKNN